MNTAYNSLLDPDSLRQGAEAKLYDCVYLGKPAILKERFSKKYRHEELDKRLNFARLRAEIRGINKAQQVGVKAPAIYFVDTNRHILIMERVEGPTAKDWIESQRQRAEEEFKVQAKFGEVLGGEIAKIHLSGLIHGDLTTSNMIVKNGDPGNLHLIDFGLANSGKVIAEDKGVDLYVLERAIQATHINCEHIVDAILNGYKSVNAKQGEAVMARLIAIRLRGRKRDMVG
ncbi:unnamed protein product, partial [Mesorhabditis belari]|uniref:non-specific serine/threonine protein kinase n=1 Tax=Mesorhabditis belari TaxID=2138241 RepID=A0AAF3EP96_9BILA